MPLQEFWNEDPDLLWVYRTSYMQKKEIEIELKNYEAWLYGMYNYIAIGNAFSKNGKYLNKPIELNKKQENTTQEKYEVAKRIKEKTRQGKIILEQQKGR